jgi:hypothetical protein
MLTQSAANHLPVKSTRSHFKRGDGGGDDGGDGGGMTL